MKQPNAGITYPPIPDLLNLSSIQFWMQASKICWLKKRENIVNNVTSIHDTKQSKLLPDWLCLEVFYKIMLLIWVFTKIRQNIITAYNYIKHTAKENEATHIFLLSRRKTKNTEDKWTSCIISREKQINFEESTVKIYLNDLLEDLCIRCWNTKRPKWSWKRVSWSV